MHFSESLFAQFETARSEAMALTDAYNALCPNTPESSAMWQRAMQRTETARQLLETWLEREHMTVAERNRELVLA